MRETLRWAYEAAVERILRKRLLAHQDKWFLAGIDTAYEAANRAVQAGEPCVGAILVAREGYLEEVASR